MSTFPPASPGPGAPLSSDRRRKGTVAIWVGGALMAIGVVLGITLFVGGFVGLFQTGTPVPVSEGMTDISFDAGDRAAIYRFASTPPGEGVPCSVEAPDGSGVALEPATFGSTSYTVGTTTYFVAARFDVEQSGTHRVSCTTTGTQYAVGKDVPLGRTLALTLGGVAIGSVLFIAGVITLVVGFSRRKDDNQRGLGDPGYGAGWGPGPGPGPWQGPGPPPGYGPGSPPGYGPGSHPG